MKNIKVSFDRWIQLLGMIASMYSTTVMAIP